MAEPRKLSIPTMFCFGVGEAAGSFKNMAWGVLLLFYYQQIVGVEAALVGLAIAISVVMDAVTDPLIGAWSDRIKTRWGRRHPMLVASALPLAVSFVFLFAPPEGISDFAGFLWLTTFGVLVRASYTFYNIPHLSLGAEMSHDYYQRSTLFAYSAFIGAMSVSVSYGLITGYYFPTVEGVYDPGFLNPDGYPAMSRTFAVVMVVAILVCAAGTRKEIPNLRETQERPTVRFWTLLTEIWEVLKNRSFRAVFLGLLLASLVTGVELAFTPFLGIHFWGFRTEQLFYLAYVGLFAFPVSFMLTPLVTRLFDKRLTVMTRWRSRSSPSMGPFASGCSTSPGSRPTAPRGFWRSISAPRPSPRWWRPSATPPRIPCWPTWLTSTNSKAAFGAKAFCTRCVPSRRRRQPGSARYSAAFC